MKNAILVASFRYNGILVKQIFFFGQTIYLFKVNRDYLNFSCSYHRTKETIRRILAKN